MPAILKPDRYLQWLSEKTAGDQARDLLDDPLGGIVVYPVSPYVNKPVNNDAGCIQPQM